MAALPQQPGRMVLFRGKAASAPCTGRSASCARTAHERKLLSDDELKLALQLGSGLVSAAASRSRGHARGAGVVAAHVIGVPKQRLIARATLDLDLQHLAAEPLRHNLSRLRWAQAHDNAAVVTDVSTGEVLAYVGSRDYFDAGVHGAIPRLLRIRSASAGLGLKRSFTLWPCSARSYRCQRASRYCRQVFPKSTARRLSRKSITTSWDRCSCGRRWNSRNVPALRLLSQIGIERWCRCSIRAG